MLQYTQVVAGLSTNVTTPTTEQINQGNNQLTPYDSAVNNGYYRLISRGVADLSQEITNVLAAASVTPSSSLNQLLTALDILYPRASSLGTASTKNTGTSSGNVPLIGTQSATTSLAGLASLATSAEVSTGTNTNKIITPAALAGAMPNSKGVNGYEGSSNGFFKQWGSSSAINPASSTSILFPTTFPTEVVSIQITAKSFTSGPQAANYVSNVTTSGFTLNNQGSSGAVSFYWEATGY